MLEMILDDTSVMLDSVILDPTLNAIAMTRPASPWFGAPNQPSTGTDLSAIIDDISWLLQQIDRPKKELIVMDTARELRL